VLAFMYSEFQFTSEVRQIFALRHFISVLPISIVLLHGIFQTQNTFSYFDSATILQLVILLELIIINYNMYEFICNKYNGPSNYIRNEVIKFCIRFIICHEK
jgi:hypothetical protein